MHHILYTKRFNKSFKKVLSGGKIQRQEVENVINILASGNKFPTKYQDHPLQGNYVGFRECHIKFDILLIYKIQNDVLVLLVFDIGTHSELF